MEESKRAHLEFAKSLLETAAAWRRSDLPKKEEYAQLSEAWAKRIERGVK